jgi:hypothetical protein
MKNIQNVKVIVAIIIILFVISYFIMNMNSIYLEGATTINSNIYSVNPLVYNQTDIYNKYTKIVTLDNLYLKGIYIQDKIDMNIQSSYGGTVIDNASLSKIKEVVNKDTTSYGFLIRKQPDNTFKIYSIKHPVKDISSQTVTDINSTLYLKQQ